MGQRVTLSSGCHSGKTMSLGSRRRGEDEAEDEDVGEELRRRCGKGGRGGCGCVCVCGGSMRDDARARDVVMG